MHNFIFFFFTAKEMRKCGGLEGFVLVLFQQKNKTKQNPFLSKETNTFFSLWHCLALCFGSTTSQFDNSKCSPLHAQQWDLRHTHWCNSHKPGHAMQSAPNDNIKPAKHYCTSQKGQTHFALVSAELWQWIWGTENNPDIFALTGVFRRISC